MDSRPICTGKTIWMDDYISIYGFGEKFPTFLILIFIRVCRNNYITLYKWLGQTEIPYDKKKIIKLQTHTHALRRSFTFKIKLTIIEQVT